MAMFVPLQKARTVCGRQPVRNGVAAFAAGGSLWIGGNRANARQARAAYAQVAAQTRIVSAAGIRVDFSEMYRAFKGIICDDISEFESHMPSHAVRSL
jgi:hypothetical protein